MTISVGFSTIKWNENEEHKALEHGKKLMLSGHIFNVKEVRESKVQIIRYCLRETNLNNKPYMIVLILDNQRNITNAHCQCQAGVTGLCKHTGALIYYINNEREESKTDKPNTWKAPSKYLQDLYPKGQTIKK